MKALAAVLSLIGCLAGVALCLFTDLYLKTHHLPKSVDVHSWDLTGTVMIAVGGGLFVLSIFALLDDDDKKVVEVEKANKPITLIKGGRL